MKTLEEAAIDCAIEHTGIERGGFVELEVQIRAHELQDAFIAGYEAAQRWIPISEEPIPLNTPVLCCNERYSRHEHFIHQKHYDKIMAIRCYTHWLPIPKLPTE